MMRNRLNEAIQKVYAKRREARRYTAMLLVLAMLTSISVSWRLHYVGTALTTDEETFCGLEEHTHTDACYEDVLVCGYEEGELIYLDADSEAEASSEPAEPQYVKHVHTDDCYQDVEVEEEVEEEELTCGLEEHTHDETCPVDPETGEFLCGYEEHTHDDSCYSTVTKTVTKTERQLVCGYEEGQEVLADPVDEPEEETITAEPEVHHHTEACYEKKLVCTIPEHTHTLECYADWSADVEDESKWEQYSAPAQDDWNTALLTVAQGQLGYTESEKNFTVDEALGETIGVHHYSRYGAFYNTPYGDWDVTFVSFCQHYAGIPISVIPQRAGLLALRSDMESMNFAYLTEGEDAPYVAIPGDIVTYYNTDGEETIGIVEDCGDDTLTVISGAVNGTVARVNVLFTDVTSTIRVDDAYAAYMGEEPDADAEPDDATGSDFTTLEGGEDAAVYAGETVEQLSWTDHVTETLGSGKASYDAANDRYTVDMLLKLNIPHDTIDPDKVYELSFPAGVTIPSKELDNDGFKRELLESGAGSQKTGYYRFIQKDDGTYAVQFKFDKEYHGKTDQAYKGEVRFEGQMKASSYTDDGKVKIGGEDGFEIDIDKKDIDYPDGDNGQYDLTTKKTGSYDKANKTLNYTVTVSSKKGTPGKVDFEDVIDKTKLDDIVLGNPTIKVEKRTVTQKRNSVDENWYEAFNSGWAEDTAAAGGLSCNESGKITGNLPQMTTTCNGEQERTYTEYRVTYSYPLASIGDMDYTGIKNGVTTTSKTDASTDEVTSKDETSVDIKNTYNIEKRAEGYSDGKIKWKITLNWNYLDISGAVLKDLMSKDGTTWVGGFENATDITVKWNNGDADLDKDQTGWKWTTGTDGKKTIEFVQIDGKPNTRYYEIIYYTPYAQGDEKYTVENKATLDIPGSGPKDTTATKDIDSISYKKTVDSWNTKLENGKLIIPWNVVVDFSNTDKIAKDTYFVDTIKTGAGSEKDHVLTKDQAKALKIQWVKSDGATVVSNVTSDYTIVFFTEKGCEGTPYTADDLPESGAKSFKVTFTEDVTRPSDAAKILLTYSTTADAPTATDAKYCNQFNVNGHNMENAYYTYKGPTFQKTDGNGSTQTTSFTSEDGILTWKITVKTGTLGLSDQIKVTDNLPKGVELQSVKLEGLPSGQSIEFNESEIAAGTLSKTSNSDTLTGTYDAADGKLELTLSNTAKHLKQDNTYTFTIRCKAVKDQDGNDVEAGKKYTYTNKAEASIDDVKISGSGEQTQEWTKEKPATPVVKVLDKSGVWDERNRKMDYTVSINPEGKALIDDKMESLTLEDVLTFSKHPTYVKDEKENNVDLSKIDQEALLDTASVKLYYATQNADGTLSKGAEVVGWKMQTSVDSTSDQNANKYKMTLTGVPNKTAMILEYTYRLSNNATEVYPQPTYKISTVHTGTIKNEIKLLSTTESDTEDTGEKTWDASSSSASMGSGRTLTIVKTEAGNENKTLEGATFKLQKYNGTDYEDVTPAQTYTTNSLGRIQIRQGDADKGEYVFETNTMYRVIESVAPNGYVPVGEMTPEQLEATAVYFFFGQGDGADNMLVINSTATDLNETSNSVRVENTPNATSIAVRKAWKDADGKDTDAGATDITVQLHRLSYTSEPNATGYGVAIFDCKSSMYGGQTINGTDTLANTLGVQPAGTTFQLTITTILKGSETDRDDRVTLYWNGAVQSTSAVQSEAGDQWYHKRQTTYVYTLTVQDGVNTLSAVVDNNDSNSLDIAVALSDINAPAVVQPIDGSDTVLYTETLNAGNQWQKVFNDLPLSGKAADGSTVYYAYYAVETKMDSTSIDGNGGTYGDWTVTQGKTPITSGTITIVNSKKPDEPDAPGYELPATGSTGTTPFTTAGALIMGAGLMYGYILKRRRRRRAE